MKITVKPDLLLEVSPNEKTLLDLLVKNQVTIQNICNGKGTCGKCKVKFAEGAPEPSGSDLRKLRDEELAEGFRLACTVTPQEGMAIEVPGMESTFDRKEAALLNMRKEDLDTGLIKVYVNLDQPSLNDERGDWDRLADKLSDYGMSNIKTNMAVLEKLPEVIRNSDFKVTATLWEGLVLNVEAGDTTDRIFGIAVDIGTTSVAAALVDLNTAEILKVVSSENAQTAYGADVISRISVAGENRENRLKLRDAVRQTINTLVEKLTIETGIGNQDILKMTIVANTTMHHLFMGLDVSYLAVSPFVSVCNVSQELFAEDLGLILNPQARVLLFPNIASFVGGDTVGAIVGASEALSEGNHLLIDLGTNCELFLKTENIMMACSTAAGPAFEGAGITQGMRAKPGAIEGVSISEDELSVRVIGDQEAIGICGSGLVEAIEQMKKAGIINKQGTIKDTSKPNELSEEIKQRIRPSKRGREFVLAYGSQGGQDVVLNQKDIGELQLAKGAVCAAIKTLIGMAGITIDELDSIIMAGTFATYLNPQSILDIGLVPNISPEKIKMVGNSAHLGAVRALLDHKEFMRARRLARDIRHVELGGNKVFTTLFSKSMYLEVTT